MFVAIGMRSTIIQALAELMPQEQIVPPDWQGHTVAYLADVPPDCRFVLAGGYLAGKRASEQSAEEHARTYWLNTEQPMMLASQALDELPAARVCIIGSWSAVTGSFDENYAAAKDTIHRWAKRQHIAPPRQLVVIAPPIIADSRMTRARADYPEILQRRPHCCAMDVARAIKAALWETGPDASARVIYLPATAGPEPHELEPPR